MAAGEVFANLSRLNKITTILSAAFPRLAAVIMGVKGSMEAGFTATQTLKIALSGLWDVIKAHPIIAAITAIVAITAVVANARKSAEEAAEKAAQEAAELAKSNQEELDSLNSLIEKYKELGRKDRTDSSNRAEIRDLQDEITTLVGAEADNLDLVNGKLDTQLATLRRISAEKLKENLPTYISDYNNKKNQANDYTLFETSGMTGFTEHWGNDSEFHIHNSPLSSDMGAYYNAAGHEEETKKTQKILESIYNIINGAMDGKGSYSGFHPKNLYSQLQLDFNDDVSIKEKIETVSSILESLRNIDGYDTNNDFFIKLTKFRDELNNKYQEQLTSGKDIIDSLVSIYIGEHGNTVKSYDDYLNYRKSILEDLNKDATISEMLTDGFLNSEDLQKYVDDYLGECEEFSDYYNQWYDSFGSDAAKAADELKEKLKKDDNNPLIDSWFDGLTSKEKEIILTIKEDYSSENVKTALETYSEGGTVDLTLRPVIDTAELKKAGWDEEAGGQATVLTSTYSNKEGNKAINFTPIIVDEKGNYKGVLSPKELEEYAMGVINGTREDDLHLQIGAEFTGENAVDDAVAAAKSIHELQDWFYLKGDPNEWTLNQWQEAVANWKPPEAVKIHFSDLIADEDFSDKVDGYKEKISSLQESLSKLRNGEMSKGDEIELFSQFPELASQTGNLEDAIISLINSTKTDAFADFDEQMAYMDTDDDVAALNALKNSFEGLATVQESIDKTKALGAELSNLKSTFEDIKGVIDSYNENGYLTIDNIEKIMSLEPEYVNLLIDEKGQINLNNQAYKDYIATKAKSLLVNELKSLYDSIMGMSMEEAQAYANAEAFKVETRSVQDLLTATTQLYLVQAHIKDKENNTTAWTDALKRSFSTAANYAAMVDGYISSLSTSTNEFSQQTNESTSALEAQKEALEKQKKALEDEKDALKDAKDALEDYKNALEGAQDDIQSLIDLVIDYIKQIKEDEKKALEEQIDRLEKQKDALDEQKDKYAEVIDKKKEALRLAKEEKEAADELAAKQKSVAKSRLALEVAGLDDSSVGRKAQKQAADELSTNQKDLNDFLYDQAYEKEVDALDKQQEKFEETIEKQKKKIDKQIEHIEKQIAKIDKYLNNTRKLYIDACRMIDDEGKKLYNKLWKYVYKHTSMTKSEFNHLWSSAQTAIKKYQKDNESLEDVMEKIQNKIYSTDKKIASLSTQIGKVEGKISKLDTAISNTSDAINSTGSAIGNVSSNLNGLSASITNYIQKLKDLAKAQEELKKKKKKKQNKKKYKYKYMGKTYKTTATSREKAISNIIQQIKKDYNGKPPIPYDVYHGIQAYATGTRNAKGGLSITQEQGLEAIFGKLQSGQYTMMPQGSQVFTSGQTDNLFDFSSDPQGFVKGLLDKFSYANFFASRQGTLASDIKNISTVQNKMNGDTSVSAPINIRIQGDATQSTVNALKKEANNIKEDTIKTILHYASFNKKNRW